MPAKLRRIAVYVDEPKPNRFGWVLCEFDGTDGTTGCTEVRRAHDMSPTYRQALAAGVLALEDLTGDLDLGPRETRASPKKPKKSKDDASAEGEDDQPPPRSSKSFFGFGPVR